MEMGCHAIFFLQRVNFVPRSYIILDRTHNFHGLLGDSPENQQKPSFKENSIPQQIRRKAGIHEEYNGSNITFILKRIKG